MIPSLRNYIILALGAALVVAGLAAWQYRRMYRATDFALDVQNAALKTQRAEAERTLKAETERADQLQAALEASARIAQENERDFNKSLAAARKLAAAEPPYRVRVVAGSCGAGDSGAGGKGAPVAGGGGDASRATTGLLDPAVSARIRGVVFEVEELQRDFNTCQTRLLARTKP